MKVCIAQLNPVVGDLEGNLSLLEDALYRAQAGGADLLMTSELFLTGYPPRDLLERRSFLDSVNLALERLGEITAKSSCAVLVGAPYEKKDHLFNSALLYDCGKLRFIQSKTLLPTYDVFDEMRYFSPALTVSTHELCGIRLAITICEDAWGPYPEYTGRRYEKDPLNDLLKMGADVILNLSASPFQAGKDAIREKVFSEQAKKAGIPLFFSNQVGANDELVFDGTSMAFDKNGCLIRSLPSFCQDVSVIDVNSPARQGFSKMDTVSSVHDALVLGLSDYMRKTGFEKALVGVSGGIDSAVTLAISAKAIGPKNIMAVTMPGPFSTVGSVTDSKELCSRLGVRLYVRGIDAIFSQYIKELQEDLGDNDVVKQNIQARIRGNILMAMSNASGCLVVSTGNKSELAVGYCTLYGDMSGGLAIISDVPKTMVYKLAEHINQDMQLIPESIIKKPPSAELAPGQKDQDTLLPYDVLDPILEGLIDCAMTTEQLVKLGFEEKDIRRVADMVRLAEHKRRQAPPGIKVTTKAFGMGRRIPVAAKYQL